MSWLIGKHNYFGPGKSNYTTQPVDSDDAIAREHDLLYEEATSLNDIQTADAKAIKDFTIDALVNRNYHSVLGAAGLGIKYVTEKAIGRVIYPFNLQEGKEKTDNPSTREISGTPIDSNTETGLGLVRHRHRKKRQHRKYHVWRRIDVKHEESKNNRNDPKSNQQKDKKYDWTLVKGTLAGRRTKAKK